MLTGVARSRIGSSARRGVPAQRLIPGRDHCFLGVMRASSSSLMISKARTTFFTPPT